MQTPSKTYRSGGTSYGTPGKYCAVTWYFYYPKDFLRPYGKATTGISTKIFDQKITAMNCEMLNRPNIALSEYAGTIQENIKAVNSLQDLAKHVPRYFKCMSKMAKALDVLNNGTDTEGDKAQAADKVFEFFSRKSPFIDSYLPSAVEVGSALFSTSLQTATMRYLASNPEKVSLN